MDALALYLPVLHYVHFEQPIMCDRFNIDYTNRNPA